MKATEKKVALKNRKPYERPSGTEKKKIVHEINCGLIGERAAAREYGLNRKTLGAGVAELPSFNVKPR